MHNQIIKFLKATKEAQKIEPTMYSYQDIIKRSKCMQKIPARIRRWIYTIEYVNVMDFIYKNPEEFKQIYDDFHKNKEV